LISRCFSDISNSWENIVADATTNVRKWSYKRRENREKVVVKATRILMENGRKNDMMEGVKRWIF